MLWTWITVTLLVMFLTWVAAVARFRSSISKAADDLRTLGRDFTQQAQQLTSVRHAERESKRDSLKKAKELASLRTRVHTLTTSLNSVTAERNSLKSQQTDADARITRLSEELAAAHAINHRLRVELDDATEMRWKLTSRIHTDAAQRLLNYHPQQTPHISTSERAQSPSNRPLTITPEPHPSTHLRSAPNNLGTGSVAASASSSSQQSPRKQLSPVASKPQQRDDTISAIERDLRHSVSFEHLLQMTPDLSLPEHNHLFDEQSEQNGATMDTAIESHKSFLETNQTVQRDDGQQPLSLDRAPWVDTINPDITKSVGGSMAAALHPTIAKETSGLIVSGMRSSSQETGTHQTDIQQSTC